MIFHDYHWKKDMVLELSFLTSTAPELQFLKNTGMASTPAPDHCNLSVAAKPDSFVPVVREVNCLQTINQDFAEGGA